MALRDWLTPMRAWLSIGAVLAATMLAGAAVARAEDATGTPGLDFVGFVHLSDLSRPVTGSQPVSALPIGSDGEGHVLLTDGVGTIFFLDSATLQQTSAISTGFPGANKGRSSAAAVDNAAHIAYLASAATRASGCNGFETALCTAGSGAVLPSLASVDLISGVTKRYDFPPAAAGQDVAGLTVVHAPDGRTVVFALLYADVSGISSTGAPALTHALTLYAVDGDKIRTDPTNATLWSYSVPSCASLPSYTTNGGQDFLGIASTGSYAYFACRGVAAKNAPGAIQPAGADVVDFGSAFPASAGGFSSAFYPQGIGAQFSASSGDQATGRLFVVSIQPDKLYAFDSAHRAWVGAVPFPTGVGQNLYGVTADPATGRAYVYYQQKFIVSVQDNQLPLPQGSELGLGDLYPATGALPYVDPTSQRLFLPTGNKFDHLDGTSTYPSDDAIAVFDDTRSPAPNNSSPDPDSLTHDIDVSDSTPVTYGGFASGYGAKAIAVGGIHSTAVGAAVLDFPGSTAQSACTQSSGNLCVDVPNTSDGSRTFTFGQVLDTEVSNSAAAANSSPLSIDKTTGADVTSATSPPAAPDGSGGASSSSTDGSSGGTPQPFTGIPSGPTDPAQEQTSPATCSDYGGKAANTQTPGALAGCDHDGGKASGGAAAPAAFSNAPIQVGYAASATSVAGGITSGAAAKAVAVARGISIGSPGGPSITIGEVETTAAAGAAGRPGTTASKFTRSVSDVTVTDPSGNTVYTCGFDPPNDQCDPRQLTDVVSAQFESPIEFIEPSADTDPTVTGSPGGAQAEVIKDPYQYWNDYFTNADDGFEVPGLQIVFVGDQAQPSRFVLELAAVHVEAHDAIGLPPPPVPPLPDPTLKLSLTDGSTPAVPLAGGEFSLVGEDGTTASTCSTAADGIGSCSFPDVTPGNYTIKETKPPPGYAAAPDYPLSLDPGQDYTATFVNLLAIGAVHVSLTSAVDKSPLSGAVFAMYAGTSTLGTPLGTCTTGKDGACGFDKVPLGAYTMHQQSTPKGFLASDDFPFTLSDPGQDATLTFVDGTPGVKAVPGKFIPGKPAVPPHTEVIGGGGQGLPAVPAAYSTSSDIAPVVSAAPSSQAPVIAGLGQRLANLPAQLAKLLTHSPQQAVLLLFMWLVFGMPIYLWARRRQLLSATEGT